MKIATTTFHYLAKDGAEVLVREGESHGEKSAAVIGRAAYFRDPDGPNVKVAPVFRHRDIIED
jgi:hypothetical protein